MVTYMYRWQLAARTRRKWRAALRVRSQLRRAGVTSLGFRVMRADDRARRAILEGRR